MAGATDAHDILGCHWSRPGDRAWQFVTVELLTVTPVLHLSGGVERTTLRYAF